VIEPSHWNSLALATLACGDLANFRKVCARFFKRYSEVLPNRRNRAGEDKAERARQDALDAEALDTLVSTCVLPESGVEPWRMLDLIKWVVDQQPQSADYLKTYGAALYRANQFAEAAVQLDKAVQLDGKGGTFWMRYFLAMSHQCLGHRQEAREWFEKARELDPRALAGGRAVKGPWKAVVCYDALCAEAAVVCQSK
jgi:tetratricopeptide (TPR) repeat protein